LETLHVGAMNPSIASPLLFLGAPGLIGNQVLWFSSFGAKPDNQARFSRRHNHLRAATAQLAAASFSVSFCTAGPGDLRARFNRAAYVCRC
jgi:hypothetical protein